MVRASLVLIGLASCASPTQSMFVAPDAAVVAAVDAAMKTTDLARSSDLATSVDLAMSAPIIDMAAPCPAGFAPQQNPTTTPATCVVDPSTHTMADLCARHSSSSTVPTNFFSKSATACDAGTVTAAGIQNGLDRVNFWRYLVGVPTTLEDATQSASAQKCALITADNPTTGNVHAPATTATCYSSAGATSAGVSSIAFSPGNFPTAVDLWAFDTANASDLGNRRELLARPLQPIGIGIFVGGTVSGSAACMQNTSAQGTGAAAEFIALPPPGFCPIGDVPPIWTLAYPSLSTHTPFSATVTRKSDNAALSMTTALLTTYSAWEDTLSMKPSGWTPAAGESYHLVVTAGTLTFTYDVSPVTCP